MGQTVATLDAVFNLKGAGLQKGLSDAKTGLLGAKGSINDVVRSLTGMDIKTMATGGALIMLAGEIRKTFDENIRYAESVERVTRITGDSAEASSRLIQVADDLKISEEELGAAMLAATRKGVDVSTEGLAKLSDAYLLLNPVVERGKFLMDNFGRSGMSMAAMMEKGKTALEGMYAGVEAGLVINEKAIAQAKAYQLAVDALGDSWKSFSQGALRPAIPYMTAAIQAMSDTINITDEQIAALMKLGHTRQSAIYTLQAEAALTYKAKHAADGLTDSYVGMKHEAKGAADATKSLLDEMEPERMNRASEAAYFAVDSHNAIGEAAEKASEKVTQGWYDINAAISGDVTKNYEAFKDKQDDLVAKQSELNGKISELQGLSYRTPAQEKELQLLQGQLVKVGNQITINANEYERQTKMFVLNTITEFMKLKEMGAEGLAIFTGLAEGKGLIDEPTRKYILAIQETATEWKKSNANATATKEEIQRLVEMLAAMEKNYTINIHTNYTESHSNTGGSGEGPSGFQTFISPFPASVNNASRRNTKTGASGLDFIVPPGYPNDSYKVGVQSGERVQVSPTTNGMGGGEAIGLLRKIAKNGAIDERKLSIAIRDAILQVSK